MANSLQLFVFLAISVVPSVFAATYVVGDETGWTLGVDYASWARGKTFVVGDSLIFKYAKGRHNVFKINGTGFQQCAPPPGIQPFESGNDAIRLTSAGRKWYICGVGQHCQLGQKLFITVQDWSLTTTANAGHATPAPSPLPRARTTTIAPSGQSPRPSETTPQSPLPSATAPTPPPTSGAAMKTAVSVHLGFLAGAFGILAEIMIMT